MDTTLDYFHKQLTSRRDKDHRAERILARSYPARYKRYFIQFFLNYFKYNVYIYIYTEQAFSIEEEMKRFFDEDRRSLGRDALIAFSKFSRASMVTCANLPRQKRRRRGRRNDSRLEPAVYDWAV